MQSHCEDRTNMLLSVGNMKEKTSCNCLQIDSHRSLERAVQNIYISYFTFLSKENVFIKKQNKTR